MKAVHMFEAIGEKKKKKKEKTFGLSSPTQRGRKKEKRGRSPRLNKPNCWEKKGKTSNAGFHVLCRRSPKGKEGRRTEGQRRFLKSQEGKRKWTKRLGFFRPF